MGKGTILQAGEGGKYTISLDYGSAQLAALINNLQSQSETYADAIAILNADKASLESELSVITTFFDNAVANYRDAPDDATRAAIKIVLDERSIELIDKQDEIAEFQLKIDRFAMQKANADAKITTLQAISTSDTKDVWCVEYNVDLDGEVGTIEVNAEQPQILIGPGGAPYSAASDGIFTSRDVLSPEASFLNVALLPGWQKYSPTYRIGEITELDSVANTASVLLDNATSSAQNLDINQIRDLINVPVEYLSCNAQVFELGDRVVVKFEGQEIGQPKVIGFESNPRPCDTSCRIRFNRVQGNRRYFVVPEAIHNGGIETPGERIWQKMTEVLSGPAGYIPDPSLKVQQRYGDTSPWLTLGLSGYGNLGFEGTTFAYVFEELGASNYKYFRWNNYSEFLFRGTLTETPGVQLETDCLYWWRGASPPADPPCYHYLLSTRWATGGEVQEYRILVNDVEEFRIAHRVLDHQMFGVDLSDQLLDLSYGSITNTGIPQTSMAPYSWKP